MMMGRMIIRLAVFCLCWGGASSETWGQELLENVWQAEFKSIDGGQLRLEDYRGKVLLVVNTASKCGFTPQYKGLQDLWDAYRYRGLVVIGVPSNDFANQEPDDEDTIKEFCELRYGVTFPMTKKERVTGKKAHPFYRWAASQLGVVGRPHWNFHKYLITADGRVGGWFSALTKPSSEELKNEIEALLDEAQSSLKGR